MTHPTCPSEAPKSSWMLGTLTLTIEVFRTATKTVEIRTARSSRVDLAERATLVVVLPLELIGLLPLSDVLERLLLVLPGTRPEPRRHLDHEAPERFYPPGHALVADVPLLVERFPRL